MPKLSAGLLLYNFNSLKIIRVLLVHPDGPFWKNKDEGAWSIPKGEYEEGEDALLAAKREFKEETGNEAPSGNYLALEPVKIKSGKIISVWAKETELAFDFIKSNEFEMEWPPRSGKKQFFPEVDKAEWFFIDEAKVKMNNNQISFLHQLVEIIKRGDEKE